MQITSKNLNRHKQANTYFLQFLLLIKMTFYYFDGVVATGKIALKIEHKALIFGKEL